MQKGRIMLLAGLRVLVAGLAAALLTSALAAEQPVALHVESFTVPPATESLLGVAIKNLTESPYQGSIALKPPPQWRVAPPARAVTLAAGATERVSFTIEKGMNSQANSYALEVTATGGGTTVVRRQQVVCASAPYHKATIDGLAQEWDDAIPVTFTTGGKRTILSTYWNRRQFLLLAAVEEDRLSGYPPLPGSSGCDAVQIAIAPAGAVTGTAPDQEAQRYEFLLVSTGSGTKGACFQLAQPGTRLATTRQRRALEPLEYGDAKVAVTRKEGMTYYEFSLPFGPLRDQIRPSEGREFCFSVLVHDPDGTGLRDWGEAVGLGPWRRNCLAWSDWPGAEWGDRAPFDNKLPWGLCSSKY
jgi:alpha-galactosidase-like protein